MFTEQVSLPGRSQMPVPEIASQEPNPSLYTPHDSTDPMATEPSGVSRKFFVRQPEDLGSFR